MAGSIGGTISNIIGGVLSGVSHAFHDGNPSNGPEQGGGPGQSNASDPDAPVRGSAAADSGEPPAHPDGPRLSPPTGHSGGGRPVQNGDGPQKGGPGGPGNPDGDGPNGGGPGGPKGGGPNGGPPNGGRPATAPGPGGQNGGQTTGPGGNAGTGAQNFGPNGSFNPGSANVGGFNIGGSQGGLLGDVTGALHVGGWSASAATLGVTSLGSMANAQPQSFQSSTSSFFSDDVPRFVGDTARQVVNDVVPQRSTAGANDGGRNASIGDQQAESSASAQRFAGEGETPALRSDAGRPSNFSSSQPQQTPPQQQTREQPTTNGAVLTEEAEPQQLLPQGAPLVNAAVQEGEEELLLLAGMNGALVEADGEEKTQAAANSGKAAAATAEEMALLGKALAQANANALAKTDGKDPVLQQGFANATSDPDGPDARATQQLADGRRANEMLDRAMAKTAADAPTQRAAQEAKIIDPRTLQAQTRAEAADAKALREGGDKGRLANLAESGRNGIGENARRALAAAANGRARNGGAVESMRQALDWIGQQIRGSRFEDADSNAEGVHAMRVVAGLIVAGVTVAVAIGVMYALDLGFAG